MRLRVASAVRGAIRLHQDDAAIIKVAEAIQHDEGAIFYQAGHGIALDLDDEVLRPGVLDGHHDALIVRRDCGDRRAGGGLALHAIPDARAGALRRRLYLLWVWARGTAGMGKNLPIRVQKSSRHRSGRIHERIG
jgi:hypothetical protein